MVERATMITSNRKLSRNILEWQLQNFINIRWSLSLNLTKTNLESIEINFFSHLMNNDNQLNHLLQNKINKNHHQILISQMHKVKYWMRLKIHWYNNYNKKLITQMILQNQKLAILLCKNNNNLQNRGIINQLIMIKI